MHAGRLASASRRRRPPRPGYRFGTRCRYDILSAPGRRQPVRTGGVPHVQKTVLGIETTCDETAAAIVRARRGRPGVILSNAC